MHINGLNKSIPWNGSRKKLQSIIFVHMLFKMYIWTKINTLITTAFWKLHLHDKWYKYIDIDIDNDYKSLGQNILLKAPKNLLSSSDCLFQSEDYWTLSERRLNKYLWSIFDAYSCVLNSLGMILSHWFICI